MNALVLVGASLIDGTCAPPVRVRLVLARGAVVKAP